MDNLERCVESVEMKLPGTAAEWSHEDYIPVEVITTLTWLDQSGVPQESQVIHSRGLMDPHTGVTSTWMP